MTTSDPPDKCANCSVKFCQETLSYFEICFGDPSSEKPESKVRIGSILSAIYKFHLSQDSVENTEWHHLCMTCSEALASLYQAYNNFNNLRLLGSVLSKKIQSVESSILIPNPNLNQAPEFEVELTRDDGDRDSVQDSGPLTATADEEIRISEVLSSLIVPDDSCEKNLTDVNILNSSHNLRTTVIRASSPQCSVLIKGVPTSNPRRRTLRQIPNSQFPKTWRHASKNLKLPEVIQGPPYKCPVCNKYKNSSVKLKIHMRDSHIRPRCRAHACTQCRMVFKTFKSLKEHRVAVHGVQQTGDGKCETSRPRKSVTIRTTGETFHFTEGPPYKCPKCDNRYKVMKTLTQHYLSHHLKLHTYDCLTCDKTFVNSCSQKRHSRICGVPRPERKSHRLRRPRKSREDIINTSEDTQGSGRIVESLEPDLGQVIGSQSEEQHSSSTKEKKEKFKCQYCGKLSATRTLHRNHVMTHGPEDEKPHVCEKCGKRFVTKSSLKHHQLTHTDDKPYSCEICHRVVKTDHSLRRHMKIVHTPEGRLILKENMRKNKERRYYLKNLGEQVLRRLEQNDQSNTT